LLIRCERCSTLYDLDDGLLSAEGSEVQCARCQHVFTVRPPQASGRTLQGVPAQEPAAPPAPPPEPPAAAVEPPAPPSGPAAPEPAAPPSGAVASQSHRPAVYRPAPSQPAQQITVTRAPVLRRDTVGTFENRLRWSHRWKWLAPALLLGAAAAAVGGFLFLRGSSGAAVRKAHAHALTLALADDLQSLEQARAELDRTLATSPHLDTARADRALVDLLLAGALAEAPAEKGELRARHERSKALATAASAALEELDKANVARAEVARARAVGGAFGGGRADLRLLTTAARAALPDDPWVATAEAAVDIRSTDRTVRDRALIELGAVVARRPDALRARYLLARGQALAGRQAESQATIAALLAVNPRHEGALGLRDAPARLPPGAPVPRPRTSSAGQDRPDKGEKPSAPPRNPDSTAGEGEGAPPAEATARPATGRPPALAPEGPGEGAPSGGEAPAGGAEGAPSTEPAPPPRLRPAAVPEPEPVRGGG
jgi:predicted Zn finger-like uncharacterized protein